MSCGFGEHEHVTIDGRSNECPVCGVTYIKRRAAAAVCPFCKRSFIQVRQHISKKHPEYALSHERVKA